KHEHPAARARRAARQMQQRWRERRAGLVRGLDVADDSLCIGIGISSGNLSFGEFGQSHRDLTAIGRVVTTAARAQSVARAGHILVTEAVRNSCKDMVSGNGKKYELKGLATPI